MPLVQDTSFNTMNKNPLNKGILTENASGIGTVTPEMVEARARELAAIAGRVSSQPSQIDYEQAKRELTGEPEVDVRASGSGIDIRIRTLGSSARLDRTPHAGVVWRRRG